MILNIFSVFTLTFIASKSSDRYAESISQWTEEKHELTQSTSPEPPCSEF